MLSNEKILDMLPHIVDIWGNETVQEDIKKIVSEKNVSPKLQKAKITAYFIKNNKLYREQLYNICAIFQDKKPSEINSLSFASTIVSILNEFKGEDYKEIWDFFKQAM